jgi:hypothetical protein
MKRPSLAETMKAVSVPVEKKYHAETRVGLRKVTVGLEPEKHRALKRLAVDTDQSVEVLLRQAIDDLLAKQ